jgi:hypothetical protein
MTAISARAKYQTASASLAKLGMGLDELVALIDHRRDAYVQPQNLPVIGHGRL